MKVPETGVPLTLTASASSGLAITFASTTTGVCQVSGATVTFLTAGTCTITASQAGDSNYGTAASVSQSFAVVVPVPVLVDLSGSYNHYGIGADGTFFPPGYLDGRSGKLAPGRPS